MSRTSWSCGRRGRCSSSRASDAPPLGGAAAVVRHRRDVGDLADLQAGGLQRPDRRLAARARALDEDVDLLHAVLLRLARAVLRGHLRGERRGLARALEADVAGGGPADHVARGVGDRDDRVVERALDVSVPVGDVLLLLAADLLHARSGATLGRHLGQLLLLGLLLAGDGLLRSLAGARVGVRALPVDRKATTVPDALVAADLDLATDVCGNLAPQVTLDLVVGVDP